MWRQTLCEDVMFCNQPSRNQGSNAGTAICRHQAAGACKHLQAGPLARCSTLRCTCLTELHELLAGTEEDRQHEYIIQQALSGVIQAAMHPRTAIRIILQVWQPGQLSAIVSCMCSPIYCGSVQKMYTIIYCNCRCWRMMVAS